MKKIKRILILHGSNTFNYGSFMMLINFIHYLFNITKEKIEYLIELESENDFIRLKKELGNKIDINRTYFEKGNSSKPFLERIKIKIQESNRGKSLFKDNIFSVIILGGDDLSEYYGKRGLLFEFYNLSRLLKKIKVFLVGQTIGPFSSYRKLIAKKILKECEIYTRDPLCSEYLKKELKINNLFESSDLAFLNLPFQKKNNFFMKKHKLSENNYITLVPSGLISSYTPNKDEYVSGWLEIIKNLLKNKKIKNKKIVLLPHVLKPEKVDDRIVIRLLKSELTTNEKKRIVFIEEDMLPSEARFILGHGFFTLTGRMHAAISTFQMGKPAISLSYSVKYAGIIGRDLERTDLIIESTGEKLWESKEIINKIENRVNYLLENYSRLKNEINKRIKFIKIKTLSQIKDLSSKLKNE